MKYVLDTNAVSTIMRGDPHAIAWLKTHARADIAVPQPVVAEIAYGIERLPRSRRRDRLRELLQLIRDEIARTNWSDAVSDSFGAIKASLEKKGERIEDLDIAIAAHALCCGATLVTADAAHMKRIAGLQVENLG
jgi:tRNA(fMet)-specific endonuclease VapC